jgi:hypothetical protein
MTIHKTTDRMVTVASVRLPEPYSAIISAYAKLTGTKVEAIASDLMTFFIEYYVQLKIIPPITKEELTDVLTEYTKKL